ncbi:MAG: hypothetical protein LBD41_04170 [Clostridiales Family XIII bacterium]|jgi:DNA polymerase III delta subunit|nr:hypothetical protein [Clostridiales Family XIII bacterium]
MAAHEYSLIEKDFAKGLFLQKRIIFLTGEEFFLSEFYAKEIKSKYINKVSLNFDFLEINKNASDKDLNLKEQIILFFQSPPIMSKKKILILSDFESDVELKKIEFEKLLDKIGDRGLLLIIIKEKYKINPNNFTLLYNFDRLSSDILAGFIKKRIANFSKGKMNISKENLDLIIDLSDYTNRDSNTNLFDIENYIKLICEAEEGSIISKKTIENILDNNTASNVFKISDNILNNENEDALYKLMILLNDNISAFNIISVLINSFEFLLGCKEFSDANFSKNKILEKLNQKTDYRINLFSKYTKKYSVSEIRKILISLYNIEIEIKSGKYSEELAMILFLMKRGNVC